MWTSCTCNIVSTCQIPRPQLSIDQAQCTLWWWVGSRNSGYISKRGVSWPFCKLTMLISLANAKVHSLSQVQASKARESGVIATSQNHIAHILDWKWASPSSASFTKNPFIPWHSSFNVYSIVSGTTTCSWVVVEANQLTIPWTSVGRTLLMHFA